jgi:beta-lactamase regulating signal transducer with metallopeptidase domain
MQDAAALDSGVSLPTFQAKPGAPPLLLFGVTAPTVLVSPRAVDLLTSEELRVSVQHEVEHMRSRDNLKKLIIHSCAFPGMAGLDRAWQEAAELAADDAAVLNRGEAVDLAAALIKLSSLAPVLPPAFTTGLVNSATSISLRVQRLLAWNENRSTAFYFRTWHFLPFVSVVTCYAVVDYSEALMWTHRLTEWFVH